MREATVDLRCGVDLVDLSTFGRVLELGGHALVSTCFTPKERAQSKGHAASLAARWAAKEASAKMLGVGLMQGVGFTDIEVTLDRLGAPTLHLRGEAQRLARRLKLARWAVSLTHDGSYAVAFVVASVSESINAERSTDHDGADD
jgi:holo-[acyl-carrier protein] synthase